MKIIDGSQGEGGGQILRSTLALSMCTQTPVRIENIRAGRSKPGLSRQHLTCVQASQTICNATVSGAALRAQSLTFEPSAIQGGDYEFSIDTAGSTCLVFQTVLPALLLANQASTVRLVGGTHSMLAPSVDFIQESFVPTLRMMGIQIETALSAYGFFPRGGGEWRATIQPLATASPLALTQRETVHCTAVVTQAQLERHIAERELARVQKKLDVSADDWQINEVDATCPGNVLSLRLAHANGTEVIDSMGQKGISAERVADRAIKAAQRYLQSTAVVGEHLCDQLLLPMALGHGGRFTSLKPSLHTLTNIAVIKEFIDCEITVTEQANDCYEVCVDK